MKKILLIGISLSFIISVPSVMAACIEKQVTVATAWENEYNSRLHCQYATQYTYYNSGHDFMVATGTSELHTPWRDTTANVSCPTSMVGYVAHSNQTYPATPTIDSYEPISFQIGQSQTKIVGRTPIEWGKKWVWRDSRTGKYCAPL